MSVDSPANNDREYYERFRSHVLGDVSDELFRNSDDDEEYCYYEDLTQNAKQYERDDVPYVPVIPLSEVQYLVNDCKSEKEEAKDPAKPSVKRKRSVCTRLSPSKRLKEDNCPDSLDPAEYQRYQTAQVQPPQQPHCQGGDPALFDMERGGMRPNECISCLNLQKSLLYYRKRFTHLFYFFSQKQLQELARQRDMYLQLLIQNLMLSKDRQQKYKNYWLLFAFADQRDRVLVQYPTLPKYEVPFIRHPLSIFQSPLVDLAQSIYKRLLQDHNAEGVKLFLQKCSLFNPKLLPITKNSITGSISRRKFTKIDDYLLQIGLEEFGYKEIQNVQKKWLPEKNVKEIKHRYKNLTCCKANDNIIKAWKKADEKPLTKEENEELWHGFTWFGSVNKIPLIVRYFLPSRSYRVVIRETQRLLNEGRRLDPGAGCTKANAGTETVGKAEPEHSKEREENSGDEGRNKEGQNECPSIMDYIKAYENGEDHYVWEQLSIETGNEDEWDGKCKAVLPDILSEVKTS